MTLEKLQQELVSAMKEKNKEKKNVIAGIITASKNAAIANKCKDNITEEIINQAILKYKKELQEQIDTCPKDRTELLASYQQNLKYVEEYAPKMMSEKEICNFVYERYMELKAAGTNMNKGIMMKAVMSKLKGKADGKLINKVVTRILKENE